MSHEREPGRLQPDARFLGDLGTALEAGLTPVMFLLVVNIVLLIAGASAGNDQSRHALADASLSGCWILVITRIGLSLRQLSVFWSLLLFSRACPANP